MILARKIRRKGKFFSNYTSSQQESALQIDSRQDLVSPINYRKS